MLFVADSPSSAVGKASAPLPKLVRPSMINLARRLWSSMTRTRIARSQDSETVSRPPLDLGGERHAAGPAARTGGGDQNALLMLLVEVGAIEHAPHLPLKKIVQRQAAQFEPIVLHIVCRDRRRTANGGFPPHGLGGRRCLGSSCVLGHAQSCRLKSYRLTTLIIPSKSPRRKQAILCSMVGNARSG